MKDIAVFCICRNEKTMLPLWFKYYSGIFGIENVYIFDDNTTDGTFDNLEVINYEKLNHKDDKSVKRYGVYGENGYNRIWHFIVNKYIELLKEYKYVINADTDDFIVANPKKYENLKSFIKQNMEPYYKCKAYEILQLHNEKNINWFEKILKQRNYWIRINNLDKTAITRERLDYNGFGSWTLGNHFVCNNKNQKPNNDLLLIHLHRIDYDEYKRKYFIEDNSIKDVNDFNERYGGYPLFYKKELLDEHFYDANSNFQFGANIGGIELIPNEYKEVF